MNPLMEKSRRKRKMTKRITNFLSTKISLTSKTYPRIPSMTTYAKQLAVKFRVWHIDSRSLCAQLKIGGAGWRVGTSGGLSSWSSSSASSSIVNSSLNRPLSVLASFYNCLRRSSCCDFQHKNFRRADYLLWKRIYPWLLHFSFVFGWGHHKTSDCHELCSCLDKVALSHRRNYLGSHMYLIC